MKRRTFLKSACKLVGGAAATSVAGVTGLFSTEAQAAQGKSLVVIFQRGAADGINTLVPYADPDYYSNRPGIAIPAPASGSALAALDLDGFFGMHPAMQPLLPIYQSGNLAFMPTVHHDIPGRSHFEGQNLIEYGTNLSDSRGWLSRFMDVYGSTGKMPAVSSSTIAPESLRGDYPVTALDKLADFLLHQDTMTDLLQRIRYYGVYSVPFDNTRPYRRTVSVDGKLLLDNMATLSYVVRQQAAPENGAIYPETKLGRHMTDVARLLKANVGINVVTIDHGSWDTHSHQGAGEATGIQSQRHAELSGSIAAFYQDMGLMMDNVMVLVMTEFGRTAKENGSGGTDHGHASCWYAIGGGVYGGIHMGAQGWPGLAKGQLFDGRDLMHTVDFRDVFAEILTAHMGLPSIDAVLPGYISKPVGFVAI